MAGTCAKRWTCRPCTHAAARLEAAVDADVLGGPVVHACVLAPHNRGPCRTRRRRPLDVCEWDGRESVRFPDPAKEDGERIGHHHRQGGAHAS